MVRRRHARLAFALVALQLAAAIVGAEHLGVQHVVCAEHGELVDVTVAVPSSSVDDDDDDSLAGRDRPHALDHEHCALAPADDDAIAPAVVVDVVAPAPIVTYLSIAPAAPAPRAIEPLFVAPKTSPPHHA